MIHFLSDTAGDELTTEDESSTACYSPDLKKTSPVGQKKSDIDVDNERYSLVRHGITSPSLASPDSRNCEMDLSVKETASLSNKYSVTTSHNTDSEETVTVIKLSQNVSTDSNSSFRKELNSDSFCDSKNKQIENDGVSKLEPQNLSIARTSDIIRSYATSTTDPLSPISSSGSTSASNSSTEPVNYLKSPRKTRFPQVDSSPTQNVLDTPEEESYGQGKSSSDQVSSVSSNVLV